MTAGSQCKLGAALEPRVVRPSGYLVGIGLDPSFFGTHSLRRTKATLIYRRTGNLRAVQLVRYLGIEVDDALAIAEQVDV